MITKKVLKIIDELPECPAYLLGLMQHKMQNEMKERLFIIHTCYEISSYLLLNTPKEFRGEIKKQVYEKLWLEFVMEGYFPTHKYEEKLLHSLRIHFMRIEREEFRTYEKRHKKSVENIIFSSFGYYSRVLDRKG